MTAINRSAMLVVGLILVLLVAGQAAAQTFGTKVQAGDPDVGLPLSQFGFVGIPNPGATFQTFAFISYWDIGTTPGVYDDKDVVYLQFGSIAGGPSRIARENNVRLSGWGAYPAGSKVKAGDSDMGQQLVPWGPQAWTSGINTGFFYIDAAGGPGYDFDDPVYLHLAASFPIITTTNDIRITNSAGLAGSKVSLADLDAALPLSGLFWFPPFWGPTGGIFKPASPPPNPIGRLAFYNANGNIWSPPPGQAIYDESDSVYLDVPPINEVSPNDIRLSD